MKEEIGRQGKYLMDIYYDKANLFESTIDYFKEYRQKMIKDKIKGYNSNLSNEVYVRLRQLAIICTELCFCEQIILKPCSIGESCKTKNVFDKGIVFAEAFYSTSWRIIYIAKHGQEPLPYLKGMKKKANGISMVRNALLMHPEGKKSMIQMPSYIWDNDGPKFKTARPVGKTFKISDRGLWINAKEFRDDFEELLRKAIAMK